MERQEILETTLGDLIVALTEEAIAFVRDEKEAYKVVASMLTHLLNNSGAPLKSRQYWH
jgi:hypothetical protein